MRSLFKLCLFFLVLLSNCTAKHNTTISGHYRTLNPNMIESAAWYIRGNTRIFLGNDLFLNPDSSFLYEACSYTLDGKWQLRGDSIFLIHKKNYTKFDTSIIRCVHPHAYLIKGNRLLRRCGYIVEIQRRVED